MCGHFVNGEAEIMGLGKDAGLVYNVLDQEEVLWLNDRVSEAVLDVCGVSEDVDCCFSDFLLGEPVEEEKYCVEFSIVVGRDSCVGFEGLNFVVVSVDDGS